MAARDFWLANRKNLIKRAAGERLVVVADANRRTMLEEAFLEILNGYKADANAKRAFFALAASGEEGYKQCCALIISLEKQQWANSRRNTPPIANLSGYIMNACVSQSRAQHLSGWSPEPKSKDDSRKAADQDDSSDGEATWAESKWAAVDDWASPAKPLWSEGHWEWQEEKPDAGVNWSAEPASGSTWSQPARGSTWSAEPSRHSGRHEDRGESEDDDRWQHDRSEARERPREKSRRRDDDDRDSNKAKHRRH